MSRQLLLGLCSDRPQVRTRTDSSCGEPVATAKAVSSLISSLSSHPVQSQSWHQKEEYEHDTQLDEEQQHQSAEFLFVDFEEACRPGCAGVPKQERRSEIEQSEDETDDKCAEEKVAEENDLFAFHAALWQRRLTPIAQGGSVNRPYLYKQIWVIRAHFLYAGTSGNSGGSKPSSSSSSTGAP